MNEVAKRTRRCGIVLLLSLPALALMLQKTETVVRGQVRVKAGTYSEYRIRIGGQMKDAVLDGSFSASGGSGNDVIVAVVHEDEYLNFVNGHDAKAYWTSNGRKTTGKFSVRLPAGTFYLYIGNKFSAFADKHVYLDVTLSFND